jgi:putative hydrolase of the HAD superfamily
MSVAHDTRKQAVLLDALGTIVHLEEPWPELCGLLEERFGVAVSLGDARRALLVEMAHYRRHCVSAADVASLAALRLECAGIVVAELGLDIPPAELLPTLLDSLRFSAYDDVVPALERWRARGLRLVVVSNWDISLHDVLAATGLRELLDGVVCSAEVGASKPDPAPFLAALGLAGVPPDVAVHIGDSLEEDVAGARGAGIEPVLLHRGPPAPQAPAGLAVIASLREW